MWTSPAATSTAIFPHNYHPYFDIKLSPPNLVEKNSLFWFSNFQYPPIFSSAHILSFNHLHFTFSFCIVTCNINLEKNNEATQLHIIWNRREMIWWLWYIMNISSLLYIGETRGDNEHTMSLWRVIFHHNFKILHNELYISFQSAGFRFLFNDSIFKKLKF